MTELFARKAPAIMRDLLADFPAWDVDDVAAVLGNIGGETGGFRLMQEEKPLVKGSRGGFGWCQWTGPRRRAFEAWCAQQGLHVASDEANYGYLVRELRGTESKAIAAVARAGDLAAKVVAFERSFERAGIPHHDSRIKWAKLALRSYQRGNVVGLVDQEPEPEPDIEPDPQPDPAPAKPGLWQRLKGWLGWGGAGTGGVGLLGYFTDLKVVVIFLVTVAMLGLIVFVILLWLFGKDRLRDWIARQVHRCFP